MSSTYQLDSHNLCGAEWWRSWSSVKICMLFKACKPFPAVQQGKWNESLTQENNNAEQDGNQSSCAQPCWKEQSFSITGLHVSPAVTGTHSYCQRASATLDGVVIVKYYYWQQIGVHFIPAVSIPPCYNSCCVI